ncbi:MAG: substrate-binding domain-containing protein [Acidobacteriaceae bacterium]|nr:substrate-binding domain-containing protein [Acidobacteriaceae bacterium]
MKIRYRKTLLHVVLLLAVPMIAGCRQKQPPTVAVIAPAGGLHYWEVFNHQVKAEADAAGIQVQFEAPQEVTDYAEQEQMVEDAIANHVQGIVVAPSHQLVLASVLRKAKKAGIAVVVIGSPIALAAEDFDAFVGWDVKEAGRLAARRFAALMGGKGEIGIVGVSPTVESSSRIEESFAEEIARTPHIKLVDVKYGLSDWARARQATLDLLSEHPNLGGIFTTDEFATHAAASTFNSQARRRPVLIGISGERDEFDALLQGKIDALVVSNPQEMGKAAIEAMKKALDAKHGGRWSTQISVTIIDQHSASHWVANP